VPVVALGAALLEGGEQLVLAVQEVAPDRLDLGDGDGPEEVAYSLASRLMISDAGRLETSEVAWNISIPNARASRPRDSSR
jgi:hypothetical protein